MLLLLLTSFPQIVIYIDFVILNYRIDSTNPIDMNVILNAIDVTDEFNNSFVANHPQSKHLDTLRLQPFSFQGFTLKIKKEAINLL